MTLLWFFDRAAALVAYATLYMAVMTGIFYADDRFGRLSEIATAIHVEVAVLAMIVTLAHSVLGLVDTGLILSGGAPAPPYSDAFLLAGVTVGAGALLLLVVSVLGFLDARRFERPWGPRIVHAFAYGGFAFATLHAVAVGTDLATLGWPLLVAGIAFLAYVLLIRLLAPSDPPAPEPQ